MPDPSPDEKRTNGGQGTRLNPWQRLKGWLRAHRVTLMALKDTPHALALGSAIGMFFGFKPLKWSHFAKCGHDFGLKTLLSFRGAWLCKGNKTAAVIMVTLHDILLPCVPAMFFWQYKVGMWALHGRVPQRPGFRRVVLDDFMEWTTFLTVGRPILVGSLYLALPVAVAVYFAFRGVLIRAHRDRRVR